MKFKVYRPNYGTTNVLNAHPKIEFTKTHVVFLDQRDGYPLIAFLAEDVVRIERDYDGS